MKTAHWLMLLPSLWLAGYIFWQTRDGIGLDSRTWRSTASPTLPWIIAKWLGLFALFLVLGFVFFIMVATVAQKYVDIPFPFTS